MGFIDDFVGFLLNTGRAVVYAAGTIVGITAAVAVEFIRTARDAYREYREKHSPSALEAAKQSAFSRTRDVNDEIIDLETKKRRDRYLRPNDQSRLDHLYATRKQLRADIQEGNEILIAESIDLGKGVYGSLLIDDANLHVLQFHIGQAVFGKHCSSCGKPMILHWNKSAGIFTMKGYGGFFWGCTGYYDASCRQTEQFTHSDISLFTRIDRPEFQVPHQQLERMILLPGPKNSVNARMHQMKNEVTDVYLCPVHNEPMILREKRKPGGLLDQYFYGCPRWSPGGNGCNQIVKLSSAAQLTSALEAHSGRGIL